MADHGATFGLNKIPVPQWNSSRLSGTRQPLFPRRKDGSRAKVMALGPQPRAPRRARCVCRVVVTITGMTCGRHERSVSGNACDRNRARWVAMSWRRRVALKTDAVVVV